MDDIQPDRRHLTAALQEILMAFLMTRDTALRSIQMESAVLFGKVLATAPEASVIERMVGVKAATLLELSGAERVACASDILATLAPFCQLDRSRQPDRSRFH